MGKVQESAFRAVEFSLGDGGGGGWGRRSPHQRRESPQVEPP